MTVLNTGISTVTGRYCGCSHEHALWTVVVTNSVMATNEKAAATPRVRIASHSGLECAGPPAWFSEPEHERWFGLGKARRAPFLGSRILMRDLLADELGGEPKTWLLDGRGSPLWPLAAESIRTSISHNREHAAVALCTQAEGLGIDLERPQRRCRWQDIARRWYSAAEQALLADCEPQNREQLFYRLWTLKEAWVKATGRGLAGHFQAIRACPDKDTGWQLEADTSARGWRAWSGWVGQEWLAIIWRGGTSGEPRIETTVSDPTGAFSTRSRPITTVHARQFEIRVGAAPHTSAKEQ